MDSKQVKSIRVVKHDGVSYFEAIIVHSQHVGPVLVIRSAVLKPLDHLAVILDQGKSKIIFMSCRIADTLCFLEKEGTNWPLKDGTTLKYHHYLVANSNLFSEGQILEIPHFDQSLLDIARVMDVPWLEEFSGLKEK